MRYPEPRPDATEAIAWIEANADRLLRIGEERNKRWFLSVDGGYIRLDTGCPVFACPLSAPLPSTADTCLAERHSLPLPVAREIVAAADRAVGYDDRVRDALLRNLRIGSVSNA